MERKFTHVNSVEQRSKDNSTTNQSPKRQRNKLIRSTESFGNTFENSNNDKSSTTSTRSIKPAQQEVSEYNNDKKLHQSQTGTTNVMGGGFTAPPVTNNKTPTATNHNQGTVIEPIAPASPTIIPMHEKLFEKGDLNSKEKTDKIKLLSSKHSINSKDKEKPEKVHKESKFAERLRRSFRRSEHKSFELKRTTEKSEEFDKTKSRTTPPPESTSSVGTALGGGYATDNNNFVGRPLKKHSSRSSILSLSNLPGLSGHINPALLLDSPDESTPPEYAYQHLSSVATTNSSTSLESNFDFNEVTSSQTSIFYWAWQQQSASNTSNCIPAMGSEISTNVSTGESEERAKRRLETQSSSKSDSLQQQQQQTPQLGSGTAHTTASRSCSITSESSSVKLTRLQNFLFKSSNESTRSFQGHSNEGFTASSHNSSSGEWEQLGAFGATGSSSGADFQVGSFPEESISDNSTIPRTDTTGETGSYYQYTLTSPNNPFLPEITARTYHSTYEDDLHEEAEEDVEEEELDANTMSVKYTVGGGGTRSTQLSTPAYSRAGSQESTHSESGLSSYHAPHGPTPSPASSSSSTPGRHKRKLFSLNSPTRLLHHHQHQQHQQTHYHQPSTASTITSCPQNVVPSTMSSSPMTAESSKFNSANLIRSLNPFLPISSSPSSPKRAPLKQSAVTSPVAVPQDLNARREEFLRATMKICLVVSPPTSKLQLKSKSLTHLDGLDSMIACQHGTALTTTTLGTTGSTLGRQSNVSETKTNKTESLKLSTTSTSTINTIARSFTTAKHHQKYPACPPTIYTQAPVQPTVPPVLSPSINSCATATSCCHGRICCLGKGNASGAASNPTHQSRYNSNSGHQDMAAGGLLPTIKSCTSHAVNQQFQSNYDAASSVVASVANPPFACGSATPTSAKSVNIFYYNSGAGTPTTTTANTSNNLKKKSSFMTRKKPLLTRSEVSSSEYFSVSFCTETGSQADEEFIPATKGVTLNTALSQALKRRNLSFSQITISDNNPTNSFLDAGFSPLASLLDENTEVEILAGHHLIVTERDSSRKTLQKAASFGSRTRPPRLLSSASTEETSESANVTGKQIKQRWSGLFGTKNPSQSQLCELLNGYAKNGVPQKTAALNFDHPEFDAALAYLDNMHKSWLDFVKSDGMSDSEMKIQTAIWELVTTEVYYIHALQTVTDLFLACLEAVQEERLLSDVDQNKLFSNVRDICEANLKFWTTYLYPMVAHSVNTGESMRCGFFHDGFVAFAAIFAPYKKYCAEQSTCQFYCKELNRNNALFTSYLAWCESQKMCNRLRLADIIVRPMQRLTKYSLLLAAIKKHMSDVDDIETVDIMIHSVEFFVCSVNNHLTMRQESERLKGVMARIESYDVVDTNNEQLEKLIKQYSQMFDLCAPMKGCPTHQVRHLFMEGDHKFKDNLGKADVHCFLLTDMLLVCKTIAKKGLGTLKVIRQPYLTDRLVVHHATNSNSLNCVYLNDFQVAVTAFTLQCTEAKNWYEALRRAKVIYTRLKQGTSGSNWTDIRFGGSSGGGGGGGGGSSASGGNADSLGVKKSPMNSSICSHVTSANNSHSGSVEWNDSRNISVDFEKTNSLSSDEGSSLMIGTHGHGHAPKSKQLINSPHKLKITNATSSNTLSVQPLNHLGQSLPNLNLHQSHTNLYHTYSNNTLLVPGATSSHSGHLLSPSHRGISYPPPSPTRVPLRRGMAFSTSTKNPPLLKTRNITSQNSINWHQIPATPTPPSPHSQHNLPLNNSTICTSTAGGAAVGVSKGVSVGGFANLQKSLPALVTTTNNEQSTQQQQQTHPIIQLSNQHILESNRMASNETDV